MAIYVNDVLVTRGGGASSGEGASGVSSFNGRTGAVSPSSGDYTAEMVGALPQQTGTAGQFLGFTSDNTVGPMSTTVEDWTFELEDGSTVTKKVVLVT